MMELKELNVVFFGTSDYASIVLNKLLSSTKVRLVITQPDKPVGRKKILTPPPIKQFIINNNINTPIKQYNSLKDGGLVEELKKINANIFIVAAYGKIIPKSILEIPKFKSINIHGSILPKYRGASPIQTVLLNGEVKTGNTIMLMDEKLDHGHILSQSIVNILPNDLFKNLENKLAIDGANLLINTLKKYINNKIKTKEQDESEATYTNILKKDDGFVDVKTMTSQEIVNKFRAYSEWPGISLKLNGWILKLNELKNSKEDFMPGELHASFGRLMLGCKEGSIEILQLTPQGKKKMNAKAFINGYIKK